MKRFENEPGYVTSHGRMICGDSLDLIRLLEDNSVNLIVTSPPFALQRQKAYGNKDQSEYVDWLCRFAELAYPKLATDGSLVLDLGGAYEKGVPAYSLHQFRVLLQLCDETGYVLAQPFYWHNPSALPAPIEWVNKRKLRAKTSVNTVWWLAKDPWCQADITQVLTPYSARMARLIQKPEGFVKEEGTARPSGHVLGQRSWTKNNGGAIPPNLLQIPNTESNSQYLRYCKALGVKGHPARFPSALPEFFIKLLTEPDDLVVDIFAGSNTTGQAAERLNRRWLGFELSQEYVAASISRFVDSEEEARDGFARIMRGEQVHVANKRADAPYQIALEDLVN